MSSSPSANPTPDPAILKAAAKGTWVIDLDGVIWLSKEPIRGSGPSVDRLQKAGLKVLFATNNAAPTLASLVKRLKAAGIEAKPEDLVSSSEAAATLLEAGSKAFLCAEEGVREALVARGIEVVEDGPADAVVVGWTPKFDFELLSKSMEIIRAGARLIATNADATRPIPGGLTPGAGSILAAVTTASGTDAEIAGKPHQPMADLVHQRAPDVSLMVGDRPDTDGLFARTLGVPFALVHSGVTPADHGKLQTTPDLEGDDLEGVVDLVLG
jgi:4-nitrophenyl phosphatase